MKTITQKKNKAITAKKLIILLLTTGLITLTAVQSLMADIYIMRDGSVLRGKQSHEDARSVKIIEHKSQIEMTLRRGDVVRVVDESHLDKNTLENYQTTDWKAFDFEAYETKKALAAEREKKLQDSFLYQYSARTGLRTAMLIPTGEIGGTLKNGIGFGLLFDIRAPVFDPNGDIEFRSGISAAYAGHSSDIGHFPADVTLISFMLNNEIGYKTGFGLRPYFKIGLGLTLVSLTDNSKNEKKRDTSSTDLTLFTGLGAGYRHAALPTVEFFLETGYAMYFENTRGDFIDIGLGVTYHFNAGGF
jgi:opacity protein-like surface antigen